MQPRISASTLILFIGALFNSPAHTEGTIKVFIVAGQSNAVGYNNVSKYRGGQEPFPEVFRIQPAIMFWPGKAAVAATDDLWTTLGVQNSGAFGPEIGLAHDLAKAHPGEDFAIIKYAEGATGIARSKDYSDYIAQLRHFNDGGRNWYPSSDPKRAGFLYNALIANVRAAIGALQRRDKKSELAGFVWMQGEHEAGISRKMAEDYDDLLTALIRRVRIDLKEPGLPFIVGEINSHTWAFGDKAREGQAKVCRQDPDVTLVRTVDLSRNGSGGAAHFDADGMLSLGKRCAAAFLLLTKSPGSKRMVTLSSLLEEMVDRDAQARYPDPVYRSLQASSYNRLSAARNKAGWFADSDGLGFIRTEKRGDQTEWVIMEHEGPGCLTKFWTPYFYYGMGNKTGPKVRIYLDGAEEPVIDATFIELLTRNEWPAHYGEAPKQQNTFQVPSPFADHTARAGNLFLPIPFARRCKVTMSAKPFYHIVNYRSYPAGTPAETFSMDAYRAVSSQLAEVGQELKEPGAAEGATSQADGQIAAGGQIVLNLPVAHAVRQLEVKLDPAEVRAHPALLRWMVLKMSFDGAETVWCPLGDFFGSANAINLMQTWTRSVTADGSMICRWVMPYEQDGKITVENLGDRPVNVGLCAVTRAWNWDSQSMHFYARWRSDDIQPGNKFSDWNFVDIQGRGVFVGDQWTVLNPTRGWWGEGDEKIYADDAYEKMFPDHFGTGTEDYYGWAGGVNPTKADVFSSPFLANVSVGSTAENNSRGFNICTRLRGLDAIPFSKRLHFNVEASPGTGQRKADDFLGYSAVSFWYAMPGATFNRPALPKKAAKRIVSFEDLEARAKMARAPRSTKLIEGSIEAESLIPSSKSDGLNCGRQRPAAAFKPDETWSGGQHFFVEGRKVGDFVEFTFTEQFQPADLELFLTKSYDFGVVKILVNGKAVGETVDLYSPSPRATEALSLGTITPVDSTITVRLEVVSKNQLARDPGYFMGLDCIRLKPRN